MLGASVMWAFLVECVWRRCGTWLGCRGGVVQWAGGVPGGCSVALLQWAGTGAGPCQAPTAPTQGVGTGAGTVQTSIPVQSQVGVASVSNTNWPELPDFQSAASSARIGPAALPTPQHNYLTSYIVFQIILLKLLQKAPKPQTLSIGPFQWTRDSSQWMSFKRKWASVALLRKEEISYRDQNYFL